MPIESLQNQASVAGYALGNAADALLAKAHDGATQGREKGELVKAGRDFESLLLGQWLQGAESSFGSVPQEDGEEDTDAGASSLKEFAMQALGQAMAASGGVGIARMVSGQLGRSAPAVAEQLPQSPATSVTSIQRYQGATSPP